MFEAVLTALRAGMAKSDALAQIPNTAVHPAFQYGVVIGRHQGWQGAIDAVCNIMSAAENKDKTL